VPVSARAHRPRRELKLALKASVRRIGRKSLRDTAAELAPPTGARQKSSASVIRRTIFRSTTGARHSVMVGAIPDIYGWKGRRAPDRDLFCDARGSETQTHDETCATVTAMVTAYPHRK